MGVLCTVVIYSQGIKETMVFVYVLIAAVFINLLLFYLRNKTLKIIYKFIENNMK